MADATETIRQGESVPLTATVTASEGDTATIVGTPTVTLYDAATGLAVSGADGVAVTGQTAGAAETVEAWYTVDSAALGLAPGAYTALFTITAAGTADGLERTLTPSVFLRVEASPALENITSGTGYVRRQIETLTKAGMDPVLAEDEILYLVSRYESNGGNLYAAVAEGWQIKAAGSANRYDVTTGDSNNSARLSMTHKQCLEMYKHFRRLAYPLATVTLSR